MKTPVECNILRNSIIADRYHQLRRLYPSATPLELFAIIVASPAPRFFVSEERAFRVVYAMLYGGKLEKMRPNRARLFADLFAVVRSLMDKHPSLPLIDIVEIAVATPAPEFYLTPASARQMFYVYRRHTRRRRLPREL